ncbi:enolase C-terminal domain-like protein [Flavimaricola marinus]|uniref:L-Ala-D/L-Glu epimerase n=1 Tax=Flavimaricola marinus TaxID=1819565 RepID=A0A238LGL2_9RHOB|nr:enolase C-terminal domain-like protein [Flavimaricola marinus]SMY08829.1 L-Ala-D/L-Glu epimerase [Flavimaricola marinus]
MTLDRAEIWEVRLPVRKAVEWTVGGAETEVPYLVLILHDRDGRHGAAEITCRPAWNGMTPGLLARAIEELAWPRIAGLGLDGSAISALSGIRGMTALKAIIDNAWHDLLSPMVDGAAVPLASVLTRAEPEVMAAKALQLREETGIQAFKVKLGQGIQKDTQVLSALRKVLPDAELTGDANSAYTLHELPRLAAVAKEIGLTFLEDPCPMQPDAATGAVAAALELPLLADREVTGPDRVEAFADRGITQVSAKPNRIGISAARAVAAAAQRRGGRVCNGTYSESALGAAAQIGFASGLPDGLAHPHEIDFHLELGAQIAPCPRIRNGRVRPVAGRIADRIDRSALARFGTCLPELRSDKTKETTHV